MRDTFLLILRQLETMVQMKILLLGLLFAWFQNASETSTHVVFVVDKVTDTSKTTNYGNSSKGENGEHHSAPVVMAEFKKDCPNVSFTQAREKAQYILQTQPGSSTIVDQNGTVLYISPAKTLKNMAKDVCTFVSVH